MHPGTFDIRPVTLRDDRLEAVVGIMPVLDRGPASVREYEGLLTTMRQTLHVVAWMNGQPVGFGFAGTWPGGEADRCLGALLGVEQAHRRRGSGRPCSDRWPAGRSTWGSPGSSSRGHLHCETEARNEPMRRLLEELGYRSLPGVIELRGPLG